MSKNYPNSLVYNIIVPVITDLEAFVPREHVLREVEKIMDYEWLYKRLDPYYCHDNGRPGTGPVVLIKMVLIQHLYGIPSLRQTYQRIQDTISYRWFLRYGLLDPIPHFATVSHAFCEHFPGELATEIFEHILNEALNNRVLDTSAVFIDSTHIKASANKKKFQKEQVAKAAKVYSGQLRREVNAEREKLGKKPLEGEDGQDVNTPQEGSGPGETTGKAVSTTDPDSGMFVKGEHERQFAYEAHTAYDKRGYVLGVEVTAGNVHDSLAWDGVYNCVTSRFQFQYVAGIQDTLDRKENSGRWKNTGTSLYETQRQKRWLPSLGLQICPGKECVYLPPRRRSAPYHNRPGRQADLPQHAEEVYKLSLQGTIRGQ